MDSPDTSDDERQQRIFGTIPQQSNSPVMDDIYTTVEENLPDIDFSLSDSDDSDDGGNLEIFQRDLTLTFDEDRDLDESITTDAWSELFSSTTQPSTHFPLEVEVPKEPIPHQTTSMLQEGVGRQQQLIPHLTTNNNKHDDKPKTENQSVSSNELGAEQSVLKNSDAEQTVRKKSTHQESVKVVSQYMPSNTMLGGLDGINMNEPESSSGLYSNLRTDIPRAAALALSFLTQNQESKVSNSGLVEKLADFACKQSGQDIGEIDLNSGAVKSTHQTSCNVASTSTIVNSTKDLQSVLSCGTSTGKPSKSVHFPDSTQPNSNTQKAVKHKERNYESNTIHLDLRQSSIEKDTIQPIAVEANAAPHTGESSSESSDDDEVILWHEQRRRMKQNSSINASLNGNALNGNTSKAKSSQRKIETENIKAIKEDIKKEVEKSKQIDSGAILKKRAERLDAMARNSQGSKITKYFVPPSPTEDEPVVSDGADEDDLETADSAAEQATDANSEFLETAEHEIESKQDANDLSRRPSTSRSDEIRRRNHVSRLLDTLRPNYSASMTLTLFDIDQSYEPEIRCLPSSHNNSVLLLVQLSPSNQLVINDKVLDPIAYSILLTWLLTLVPIGSEDCTDHAPFDVIGLQQAYLHNDFVLAVAVQPNKVYSQKNKFIGDVEHYLQAQSLQSISTWSTENLDTLPAHNLHKIIKVVQDTDAVCKLFNLEISHYWQSLQFDILDENTEEYLNSDEHSSNIENSFTFLSPVIFSNPDAMHAMFTCVQQEGLDIAGIRLCYVKSTLDNEISDPALAICLRGCLAVSRWGNIIGPTDPMLAKRTDPNSLRACFAQNVDNIISPRSGSRIHAQLVQYFGGRISTSHAINVDMYKNDGLSLDLNNDVDSIFNAKTCYLLSSKPVSRVVVVLSPLVTSRLLGLFLAVCERFGFILKGIKRAKLSEDRLIKQGFTSAQVEIFSADHSTDLQYSAASSTVICLAMENAVSHARSLCQAFILELKQLALYGLLSSNLSTELSLDMVYKILPHSEMLIKSLCGDLTKVPQIDLSSIPGHIDAITPPVCNYEQCVCVCITGLHCVNSSAHIIGRLLGVIPESIVQHPLLCFELLGIKLLPTLHTQQARNITQYAPNTPQWKEHVRQLCTAPALIILLRGVNAFDVLHQFFDTIPLDDIFHHLDLRQNHYLVSRNAKETYSQAAMFFHDNSLFADNSVRHLYQYLPPPMNHVNAVLKKSMPHHPIQHESLHYTLLHPAPLVYTVLVVSSLVSRRHMINLLRKIYHEGFSVCGFRLALLNEDEKDVIYKQCKDQTNLYSSSCMVLCLESVNAVYHLRELIGLPVTLPKCVQRSTNHTQTWSIQYAHGNVFNFYASRDYNSAINDVATFFPHGLSSQVNQVLQYHKIIHPCYDKSIHTGRSVDINSLSMSTISAQTHNSQDNSLYRLSALTQTSCLILTSELITHGANKKPAYIEILDHLIKQRFDLIAVKWIGMDTRQAQDYCVLVGAGSFKLVPMLTNAASLVLIVQRDNAVLSFDSLLGSSFNKDSIGNKYGSRILRPRNIKQAAEMVSYFFDVLPPGAQATIINKK